MNVVLLSFFFGQFQATAFRRFKIHSKKVYFKYKLNNRFKFLIPFFIFSQIFYKNLSQLIVKHQKFLLVKNKSLNVLKTNPKEIIRIHFF